ncbi:MAG: FAD-binding oxidoreductase [Solirubrobacterales bacterium]|nr:FAD-binding oxidoreductase [Solirubrobacterales bacterium]
MRVTVLGAGVVGCAAAAELARLGAEVVVVDPAGIAAGASGRNSGSVQHPMEERTLALHEATLGWYRELGVVAGPPQGVLVVGGEAEAGAVAARFPELAPEVVADAAALEPCLAPGQRALRLDTGWTVSPERATRALAELARSRGASFVREAPPPGDVLLDARGAWDGRARPVWGVTAVVDLPPPRHVIEEAGVDSVGGAAPPERVFSIVATAEATILGSTFLAAEPDPAAEVPALVSRGARFVPALRDARVLAVRACPRPVSPDGLPWIGRAGDGLGLAPDDEHALRRTGDDAGIPGHLRPRA